METRLSTRACIKYGWETFKKRPWFFVGVTLLITILTAVVPATDYDEPGLMIALVFALSLLLNAILRFFEMNIALKAHDDVANVGLGDAWRPALFPRFFGGYVLYFVIVFVGCLLLVVPGIILGMGLLLTTYLIVDRDMRPVEALKESWRLTKGHKWNLLFLLVTVVLLNIVGLILLLVGLLVTAPVSVLALVHAYRTFAGSRDEITVETAEPIGPEAPVIV